MIGWPTLEDQRAFARVHWEDARQLDDALLDALLDAALPAVIAYAPALGTLDAVVPAPTSYQLAVVFQARELRNAIQRGEADVVGVGDYALRARPLTAAVKSLLRPQRGRPGVG
jgi:hypothetical protein